MVLAVHFTVTVPLVMVLVTPVGASGGTISSTGKVTGDAAGPVRRRAYLASRTNTYLSGPMLVGMLGANHAGMGFGYGKLAILWVLALVGIHAAIFHSPIVGKSV